MNKWIAYDCAAENNATDNIATENNAAMHCSIALHPCVTITYHMPPPFVCEGPAVIVLLNK